MCHSERTADSGQRTADSKRKLNAIRYTLYAEPAFSLIETVTALIILAIVTSSVLVVINRCVSSTADSAIRRQAFEVARDNMETVLTSTSVSEMVEVGISDKYPQIQWQTTVEPFYEPITGRMWVQAVCSAEYTDAAGELQTVELTHWLAELTKEQLFEIVEERQKEKERLAEESEDKPDEDKPDEDRPDEDKPDEDKPDEDKPDEDKPEEQELEPGTENPFGLPDDYPNWSIGEIIQWLRDNGYL